MWHKEVAALGFSDDDCYEIGKLPHKYCTKQWWVEKLQKGEILEEDPFPYEIVSIDSCNTKGCDSVQTLSQHLDSNETMSAHVDYLSLLYKSPPHHTFCCSLMEEEVNDGNDTDRDNWNEGGSDDEKRT